ncbi:nucleoside hydrolase [Dysgonomonas sp. Marseille-P4361]|uniref:nucleoside hydrolase n=1 Tax=Dysgonomonas sp. Marseille-P4361 TaxID=2161820 RepID=UPI00210073A5|nr:nucleoside hydrolase [Dysgonomonas sp. Marseille-P4361]
MKTKFSFFIICLLLLVGCKNNKSAQAEKIDQDSNIISIIFETDMGNDVDDALALDMLYKYVDEGRINLLAISTNKESEYSAGYIDIMNTWYGYPNIPIGVIAEGATKLDVDPHFVRAACTLEEGGNPAFERTVKNHVDFPKSVPLYRKILAAQPDSSVVIVSVGFSTNLVQLLDSEADEYSSLSGKELVAKKVKYVSAMLGCILSENPEFNINCDIPSAQRLMQEWPTKIIVSPFEVGEQILYPGSSIENYFKWKEPNPLVVGYASYMPMPYDRQTWDLTSVLYVVEEDKNFFNVSEKGVISIDDKGIVRFKPSSDGNHNYLMVTKDQAEVIKDYFVQLITKRPLKYQSEK